MAITWEGVGGVGVVGMPRKDMTTERVISHGLEGVLRDAMYISFLCNKHAGNVPYALHRSEPENANEDVEECEGHRHHPPLPTTLALFIHLCRPHSRNGLRERNEEIQKWKQEKRGEQANEEKRKGDPLRCDALPLGCVNRRDRCSDIRTEHD